MTREEAEKELIAMLEEAEGGPSYSMEEADAYMCELLHPKNQIYLTGDTHGQFERIISFCERQQVQPESTFIILGDVGLNYYGDRRDNRGKDKLAKIPITFFCIHGNHEMRPSKELGYQVKEYHGGKVWVQPEYPNLVFAIDGEIYDFFGHSCIVIGGAYSVDKYYRLARGYNWFEDEQPSDEIKEKVERVLSERDWKIDVVLSYTCPLRYEPAEVFLSYCKSVCKGGIYHSRIAQDISTMTAFSLAIYCRCDYNDDTKLRKFTTRYKTRRPTYEHR